ncbi:MAG: cytochrome C [Gammaproteobacteria bacterium]
MTSVRGVRHARMWIAAASFAASCFAAAAQEVGSAPTWLFPLNPPDAGTAKLAQVTTPVHLANSRVAFTDAQLVDLFFAPDWHPESHSAMPEIVLHGRAPGIYACGYCHLPSGQGRPENAALAGLPAAYIVEQVADIKSGARRSAWHGEAYRPVDLMREVAANAAESDVAVAAQYFSVQTLKPRVTVIERTRIPRMRVVGWIYAIDPRGGRENLGQRLIEWAPDATRHEHRDDEMLYNAFVPSGSVRRGREIARVGAAGQLPSCTSCHGEHLQGVGLIPPLAGRSPTYLLRQLVAFKTKERAGSGAAPMQVVAAALGMSDMIAVTAYAATQQAGIPDD